MSYRRTIYEPPVLGFRFPLWLILAVALQAWCDASKIEVIGTGPERTVLRWETGQYTLASRWEGGTVCSVIRHGDDYLLHQRGWPELPFAQATITLPGEGNPQVVIIQAEFDDIMCPPPQPSRGFFSRSGPVPRLEFGAFYSGTCRYPEVPVTLGTPFQVKEQRGISVNFYPFSYDAGKGQLRVYRRIVAEVRWGTGAERGVRTAVRAGRRPSREFRQWSRHRFLDAGIRDGTASTGTIATASASADSRTYSPLPETGTLLVIVPDAWLSLTEPFVTWKKQRGLPVEVARYPADTGGSGTTAMTNYLQTRASQINLDFVILLGDYTNIPNRSTTDSIPIPSDILYTLVSGSDQYQDFFISRVSATTTTDLTRQLQRFVNYEKSPQSGAAWYQKATCIASNQDNNSSSLFGSDKEELGLERTKLLNGGYSTVDALFDPGVTTGQVSTAFNAGRSFVLYLGHAVENSWTTGSFSTGSATALQNGTMLPYVVSGACYTGKFTYISGDCLAEAFMKSSSGGAIGFVGATTAMDWDPPTVMEKEIVDLVITGQVQSLGALTFSGIQKAMDYCYATPSEGTSAASKIMAQTHLFGDCSLELRTMIPGSLLVASNPVVVPDIPFTVTVKQADHPDISVEGADVCLYRSDGIQVAGQTDATGTATLTVDNLPASEEPLILTVFHRHYVTYQAEVALGSGTLRFYTAAQLPDGFTGELYQFTLVAVGGTAPYQWTWGEVTTPPTWLSLNPTTGEISGSPEGEGTYRFTVRVSDSAAIPALIEQELNITTGYAVSLTTEALPDGMVGVAYDVSFQATGSYPPFFYQLAGELPEGMAFSTQGSLLRMPMIAGFYPLTLAVTDAKGRSDEKPFLLTIVPSPTITIQTVPVLPDADYGVPYSLPLVATGGTGTGFVWSLQANTFLPAGLAMNRSGMISGTPTEEGPFTFVCAVSDNAAPPHSQEKTFTLSVNRPVCFTAISLPDAMVGTTYTAAAPVAGTYQPFKFTVQTQNDYNVVETAPDYVRIGTKQPSWVGDEKEWILDLGFSFPFYGQTYTQVKVGDNGYLIPGGNISPSPYYPYPNEVEEKFNNLVMIAPFWCDLVISSANPETGIYINRGTNEITICWNGREFDIYNEYLSWSREFSVNLHSDGSIFFYYGSIKTGNRILVGINGGIGTNRKLIYVREEKDYLADPFLWANHNTINFRVMQPLPSWLSMQSDGSFSGIPDQVGTANFTLTAQDDHGFSASQLLTLNVAAPSSIILKLTPGWNCVSIPFTPLESAPGNVFPGHVGAVWAWVPARLAYEEIDRIEPKRGYWVYYPVGVPEYEIVVNGLPVDDSQIELATGWNLIGPVATTGIPRSDILVLPIWGWNNNMYVAAETLVPGWGYWLMVRSPGILDLNSGL